jgi:uncharacterized protein
MGMTYKYKILSIDGGGIRGIIPAIVLAEIERRTGKPIADSFDMIAGTSTGGILALGLTKPHNRHPSQPQYSASDLINLYRIEGKRIFQEKFPGKTDEWLFNPKHRADGRDAVLTQYFGRTPLGAAPKAHFLYQQPQGRRLRSQQQLPQNLQWLYDEASCDGDICRAHFF